MVDSTTTPALRASERGNPSAIKEPKARIRSSLSSIFGNNGWFARSSLWQALAGVTFGGKRDLYEVLGYARRLSHADYLAKYCRQGVATRIINKPAAATWSDPPWISSGDEASEFDKTWNEELVANLQIFAALQKVDVFAGLGMFAILVVGLDDGKSLSSPVTRGRANKVTYLQAYLEGSVAISKYDENEQSERFGLPLEYEVTIGDINLSSAVNGAVSRVQNNKVVRIHYQRVLHVADNTLENPVFGHSRLENIWNDLEDLMKITGSSAETYWMAANRGMQIDVDKEMEMNPEDADQLSAEIDEYQHGQRRFIRTRGVKIENLGSDFADPKSAAEVVLSNLSCATGIPKRVLIGAEAGQLASSQDRQNWAIVVGEREASFAEPVMLRPFIKMLVFAGVLPDPGVELVIEWPDAYRMSPLERAQTAAQMARSAANVTKALATSRKDIGETVFSIQEARNMTAFGKRLPIYDYTLPEGKKLSKMGDGPLDMTVEDMAARAVAVAPAAPMGTAPGKPKAPGAGQPKTKGRPQKPGSISKVGPTK
jgi:hypothetical protein